MQRTIDVPPERLFADAAAFMTQQGASIDSKTDLSITFSTREGMSGSDRRWASLIGGFDLAGGIGMLTAHGVHSASSATLTAIDTGAGTQVTIPDGDALASGLLRLWFVANVLREPLSSPMLEIYASPFKLLFFPDRLEVHKKFLGWRLAETYHMDEIARVEVPKKRWLTVEATDGSTLKAKTRSHEDAEQAAALVRQRAEVYSTPPLA